MSEKLIYQGQVFYPQKTTYALFIFPFVLLQQLFYTLYQLLLKVLWLRLLKDSENTDELATLVLFILFLGLCWISYVTKGFIQWGLVFWAIAWYLDYGLAQKAYRQGKNTYPLPLTQTASEEFHWFFKVPHQPLLQGHFNENQIKAIIITEREIRGGAFQSRLDKVWQAKWLLFDQSDWVITEHPQLMTVLETAKSLQAKIPRPIIFASSYGWGIYAENAIQETLLNPHENSYYRGVTCHTSPRKWHIASAWRWSHSWQLIKQIIQQSGFLIFVLIVSSLMPSLGFLVDKFIRGWSDEKQSSMDSILKQFIRNWSDEKMTNFFLWHWQSFLALGLAIAWMVYRGWQLSRVKHCWVDAHFLRVSIDNHPLGKLLTEEIEGLLLLGESEPRLLIIGQQASIRLPSFPTYEDAVFYLTHLQTAVETFQTQKSGSWEED
ncbi:MAG: hypothetical protein VKK07_12925 [Merismopediaceae bacterium]|nr:hypothetical protein [Merismopediaceae bacterium]